jgi:hypothetical protein
MRTVLITLIVATFSLVTGCTSNHIMNSKIPPHIVVPVEQPNPVPILRKAGCDIPVDVKFGDQMLTDYPAFFASCTWGSDDGETLTVWAFTNNHDRDTDLAQWTHRDGQIVIIGDKFIAELTGACCSTPVFPAKPSIIAAHIGGVIRP